MKRKLHARFLLENLEPRLMLSADLALLPIDGGALTTATDPALEIALMPKDGTLDAQAETRAVREIVFVDAGVEDYQTLIGDLAAQTSEGRRFDVVILDAGTDGIAQISSYLAQQQNVSAIHIVSHGSAGEVLLGNAALNLATLNSYANQIEGWQQALAADADLLFYGCDLAAGPSGQALIDSLALITGADVAASDDLTGHARSGGDWVLEYARGPIEAAVAFSSQAQQDWTGALASVTQAGSSSSAASSGAVTSLSFSHTVGSVANSLLLVSVAVANDTPVSGVSWGGTPLVFVGAQSSNSGEVRVEFWQLSAPTPGTANVIVTLPVAQKLVAGASTFQGVDVVQPLSAVIGNKGNSVPSTVSISSAPDHLVVDVAAAIRVPSSSVGADQTLLWTNQNGTGNGDVWAVSSSEAGAANVLMTEDFTAKGGGADKWAALAVSISPVNTLPPVITSNGGGATADISVPENTTAVTTVVATDADGNVLIYKISGGADAARFIINPTTGVLAFASAPNYEDPAEDNVYEVIVSAEDSKFSDSQTITVNVTDVNDAPYVVTPIPNQTATVGTLFSFTVAAGSFADQDAGDVLSYTAALPSGAALPLWLAFDAATSTFSGTPGIGDLGLITVRVTAADGSSASTFDDFVLSVTNINAPVANDDGSAVTPIVTAEEIPVVIDLLANDTDVDGTLNPATVIIVTPAANGSLSVNPATGAVTYTPNLNFNGSDSFTYTVNDNSGLTSNVATVFINVTAVNDPPVANDDGSAVTPIVTAEEIPVFIPVLANDTDVDGTLNPATVIIVTPAANGSLSVNPATGAVTYTPNLNFNGTDSFTYTVADDAGAVSNVATVYLEVTPINDPPVAIANSVSTSEDNIYTFNATDFTFSDEEGDALVSATLSNLSLAGGTLTHSGGTNVVSGSTLTAAQLATLVYAPAANVFGSALAGFDFTVNDVGIGVVAATLSIDVTAVNDAPAGGYLVKDVIPAAQITQSIDGRGIVTINWKATDAESDNVTLSEFMYSDDGGVTWYSPASSAPLGGGWGGSWATAVDFGSADVLSFTFDTRHADVTAVHSLDNRTLAEVRIRFVLNDGTDSSSPVVSENFTVDNESPTPSIKRATYYTGTAPANTGVLELDGDEFSTVAVVGTDVKAYLDWDKLVILVNSGADTSAITFDIGDIASAIVDRDNRFLITFTAAKTADMEGTPGFGEADGPDGLAVTTGFLRDAFGNAALTDGTVATPPTPISSVEVWTEDTPYLFSSAVRAVDPDGGTVTVTLTLSDQFAGALSTGSTGTATSTFNSVTGFWSVTGNINDVNSLLAGLTFTPAAHYDSSFTIASTISDDFFLPQNGTITMTAVPVNDLPEATANTVSTPEDTPFVFGASDFTFTDVEGNALVSATLSNLSLSGGTLTHSGGTVVNPGDTLTAAQLDTLVFTPAADAFGSPLASFDFTVNDAGPGTVSATMSIDVTPVNDDPAITSSATASIQENLTSVLTVTATDVDTPIGNLRFSIDPDADGNRFNIDSVTGALSFKVAPDFEIPGDIGADNVYQVQVTVTDQVGGTTSQLITVTVTDLRVLDQFNSGNYTGNDGPSNWTGNWVETNDGDSSSTGVIRVVGNRLRIGGADVSINNRSISRAADFSTASFATLSYTYQRQLLDDTGGRVSVEISADGSTWYTLREYRLNGSDTAPVSESFNIDSSLLPANLQVRFIGVGSEVGSYIFFDDIQINDTSSLNQAPTINSDGGLDTATLFRPENSTAVTTVVASDPQGDAPVYSVSGGNDRLLFGIDPNSGVLTFNSAPDFENPADFGLDNTYEVEVTAMDNTGRVDTQLIIVNVTNVNELPVATANAVSTSEDAPYTFSASDFTFTDVENDALVSVTLTNLNLAGGTLTYSVGIAVTDGATLTAAQLDTLVYTPAANANGNPLASFDFTVNDTDNGTVAATMSITVTPVNDLPVVTGETLNASEDVTLSFDPITTLLGNDTDLDGDILSLLSFGQPANGSLSLDVATGKLTYTPSGNYFGTDSFTYTVSDGMGGTADGVALIVVAPVADTPQVGSVTTTAGVMSEAIVIKRHAGDDNEVTHFRISAISGGTLYHADGVTPISNGTFITVAQGQDGVKFKPTTGSSVNGSFQVEASLDNVSLVGGGKATATIIVVPPVEPPSTDPGEPPEEESAVEPDTAVEPTVPPTENTETIDRTPDVNITAKAPVLRLNISAIDSARLGADDSFRPEEGSSSNSSALKILLDSAVLARIQDGLGTLDISTLSREAYDMVRGSLDSFQDGLSKEMLLDRAILSSAVVSSIGLSAGYVIWMLKGGSLLASILSSMPAWHLADPLSILAGRRGEDEDEDEESLGDIIEDGSHDEETSDEEDEVEKV